MFQSIFENTPQIKSHALYWIRYRSKFNLYRRINFSTQLIFTPLMNRNVIKYLSCSYASKMDPGPIKNIVPKRTSLHSTVAIFDRLCNGLVSARGWQSGYWPVKKHLWGGVRSIVTHGSNPLLPTLLVRVPVMNQIKFGVDLKDILKPVYRYMTCMPLW
jgi:hypothetical protein